MIKWEKRNKIIPNSNDLLIEKIAKVRGIKDIEDWMVPKITSVKNPYDLMNIDEAAGLIVKAIHSQQRISIVADIDTDGVCSTGVMFNYLKNFTDNIYYVHAQRTDGHGIETVMDKLESNTDLIIVVDSSSNSVTACKEISNRGIPIVIIDHHQISEDNPYAVIVNCQIGFYPNKNLSGSAMCYKVCQVLDDYLGTNYADEYCDLSAIGIVADLMEIKNLENRYLIHQGINNISNLGIREILKQSKINYSDGITTTNISFKIAPIIGACARMGKLELALELVTCKEEKRVKQLVKDMIAMNEERRLNQKKFIDNAIQDIDDSNKIIIYIDQIDSGFRGLIATDFSERFRKPTFVLSRIKDPTGAISYAGSARSYGDIPLMTLCRESNLFNFTQGHEEAFGLSFSDENLEKIISYFHNTLSNTPIQKVYFYDLEIDLKDLNESDIKEVEKFARISGKGFPEPKFLIKGLVAEEGYSQKLGSHVRAVMGKNNDTIKVHCENDYALMKFRTQDSFAKEIEDHYYDVSHFTTEIEAVGSLNLNHFFHGGHRKWIVTKQVFLDDYRVTE